MGKHTSEDEKAIQMYEEYVDKKGIDLKIVNAYIDASKKILFGKRDKEYGLKVSSRTKELIEQYVFKETNGSSIWDLEKYQQDNKTLPYDIVNKYYDVMRYEAEYLLDSYILYIEKNRPYRERFYQPRRKTLKKVVDKLQDLEDGNLDELFIHMPPRIGKSQIITLAISWHCAKDTEKSNLYVTYKEGLGGAFLTGVMEIWTDPTYCFSEVFPDIKVADTDAKNHKVDLTRKKKYKTLSGKGLESGLNGEYDAYGWLILDDILEGIQDVLNLEILKRKQTIFDNNVMSRKKEQCKLIHNGTIWSLHDLYSDRLDFLQNNPEAKNIRYDILKIPALNENDESNFDYDYGVGYTTQYYKTLRAKFEENDDMASWYAQYQQEPIERDGAVFNSANMKFYNGILPSEEPMKIVGACDVALGGKDYLSFPIAYVYEDGSVYIHDVVFDNSEKNITQPKVVKMIIDNNLGSAFFEANQGGEGYKDDIDRLLKENKEFNGGRGINLISKYAPTQKRKEQRIWDNAQTIREFYFRDTGCRSNEYRKFMQNVYSFTVNGKNQFDDAPDSLSTLADFIYKGSGVRVARIINSPI